MYSEYKSDTCVKNSPEMWKTWYPFRRTCCVDVFDGAMYCLRNLGNSPESNGTKWFLPLWD